MASAEAGVRGYLEITILQPLSSEAVERAVSEPIRVARAVTSTATTMTISAARAPMPPRSEPR